MLDYGEALALFQELRRSNLHELRCSLYRAACRYAEVRASWSLHDFTARASLESERSRVHDTFIDAVNILSRAMAAEGEEIEWRRRLGNDRRHIGDFACYIHCFLAIDAR